MRHYSAFQIDEPHRHNQKPCRDVSLRDMFAEHSGTENAFSLCNVPTVVYLNENNFTKTRFLYFSLRASVDFFLAHTSYITIKFS